MAVQVGPGQAAAGSGPAAGPAAPAGSGSTDSARQQDELAAEIAASCRARRRASTTSPAKDVGWDRERFVTQLLEPLLAGQVARYQRWDYLADRGLDWVEVAPGVPVIVEGVSATDVRLPDLQDLVGDLSTTPLNMARPLWQFHLIPDYEGGSALVARIHHCIADGIALISVMMTITDGGTDPPPRRAKKEKSDEPVSELSGAARRIQ